MGFSLFAVGAAPQPTPAPVAVSALPTPSQPGSSTPEIRIAAPQITPGPTVPPVSMANALPFAETYSGRVGIVSGHHGYDPGAVCPDGLTEAELNHNFAVEVASLLQRRGLEVDVLDEFDPRLTEYQANALVSIHSDSCIDQSGFKVARVTDSAIPQAEDQLVACLNEQYEQYTGLHQHPSTITDGMTGYHAFNEIAPSTPGAIIETGFIGGDRDFLVHNPKIVARGIAAGILCFLDQQ